MIGAAVILLLSVGALIFFLRQHKSGPEESDPNDAFGPVYASTPSSSTKHNTRVSDFQPMAEMESPRAVGSPQMTFDSPEMNLEGPVEIGESGHREELWDRADPKVT